MVIKRTIGDVPLFDFFPTDYWTWTHKHWPVPLLQGKFTYSHPVLEVKQQQTTKMAPRMLTHVDATALWKSASSRVSDRIISRCPPKQCQATVSVRKGSFFDKSQLPLTKLCDLLYYRSIDVSMAETVPSIVIILSGTRIWSDKWAAYAGLNQVGYIHDTVRVPMLNFVWTNHRCFVVCQVKSH